MIFFILIIIYNNDGDTLTLAGPFTFNDGNTMIVSSKRIQQVNVNLKINLMNATEKEKVSSSKFVT